MSMTTRITADELKARINDSNLTIVDLRTSAAYNGWSLEGESRGGHIAGAVSFPGEWLRTVDETETAKLLDQKQVTPDRSVVLYGSDEAAEALAARLAAHGHPDVSIYADGYAAWAADLSTAVDRLPNFDKLVTTDWLAAFLAGEDVEARPAGKTLLFHVNFGVPEEYAEDHLPGALYLDTNWLEDPADWNRRAPEALGAALCSLGITHDTTVIVYGRDTEGEANEKWPGRRAGQIAATRALMILRYAGVDDVRLLDGGYDWWVRGGHPLETTPSEPSPVAAFGVAIPLRPEVIVDIDEVREIIADPAGAALVSVRTWREHIGDLSGYDYIDPAGRIAGDVWGNSGSDASHMEHYRNVDNTMRAYPEIAANWAEAGITADKRVAFYCGTGWRASETWFYAYLQDWPRIAVYDGGWFEWSQDPINNPIEIGLPEDGAAA